MRSHIRTRSIRGTGLAAGGLALVLSLGFGFAAEAGPYGSGGGKGGGAGSARYEKYLEEEAKREKAKAAKAQDSKTLFQKAGELPAAPGGPDSGFGGPVKSSPLVSYSDLDQHHLGR